MLAYSVSSCPLQRAVPDGVPSRKEVRVTENTPGAAVGLRNAPRGTIRAFAPEAADLEVILQKLKLLEHGLYGLQQYGRNAPLDVEDIGPFYRLAEEIGSDLTALRRRLEPLPPAGPAR
jgi:hypothetical protein